MVSRNVVVTQIRSDPGSIPGISTHFLFFLRPKTLLDQRGLSEGSLHFSILVFPLAGLCVLDKAPTPSSRLSPVGPRGRAERLLPSGAASGTGTKT